MIASRLKVPLLLVCTVVAMSVMVVLNRRPDLTDPTEIAKLPATALRDAEIEHLVRAAFLESRSVGIKSEAVSERLPGRPARVASITCDDPAVIQRLAR
jgi:hypothetical protein